MKVYTDVQAFNDLYKVGDMLLIADPFGEQFIDQLTSRAIVMGEDAYISLEIYPHLVNIARVLEKVKSTESSPTDALSFYRKWLIERIHKRLEWYTSRIESYVKTIDIISRLLHRAREKLTDAPGKEKLIAHYESTLSRYQSNLTQAQESHRAAVNRLNSLMSHKQA